MLGYIGLIDFDVKNIDGSIEKLLSGLKIAFSSSIIGLTLSLILRLVYGWRVSNQTTTSTTEQIQKSLEKLSTITEQEGGKHNQILAKIAFSISGETESSVVGQLRGLRDENHENYKSTVRCLNNGFESTKEELREFSHKVSKDSSTVLIDALSEVVNDFNKTLTTQFGENFKNLNEAVGDLVRWQQNYKDHIETISEQLKFNKDSIAEVKNSYDEIVKNTSTISIVMENLETTIKIADSRINQLQSHVEQLSNIHDKANSAFPEIESKIIELTDGFSNSVKNSTDLVSSSIEEQQKTFVEFLSSLRTNHENEVNQTSNTLKKSFKTFDDTMQIEIERTIEIMGSHLASLSKKLVDDYEPLVNELRQLVALAKKVNTA